MASRPSPVCLGAAAAAVTALVPVVLAAQNRGYTPELYYELVGVDEVAVSPSGAYVAFTVTTVVEDENRRHREIWLQPISNGRPDGDPFPVTSPNEDSSGPRWSPDGSLLAFSSSRGGDPNPVWFLRVDGSGGEAFRIVGVDGPPVWSPDGSQIAFVQAPDPGDDEDGSSARRGWIAPDAISRTLDAERFDGRVITSMRYKRDGRLAFQPHYLSQEKRQLMVVEAGGGVPRQVARLSFNAADPVWSADGRVIFFTGDELEDDELESEYSGDIWAVDARGSTVSRLTSNPGTESAPSVSPDGRLLAFLSSPGRGNQTDLLVAEIGSDGHFRGRPRNLTADWDLSPGAPAWTADGTVVLFTAETEGNSHLFRVAPDAPNAPVEQVTHGARRLSSFSFAASGRFMAFTATDPVTPPELYVGSANGSTEQKATRFNDEWLSRVTLMPAEELTWTVEDGTEIQGWMIKPVGFREGGVYPMVLKIHGGPHSAYGNTFFPTFHVLSAAGFFVLYTNPRGSSGYGHDFRYATRGEWGIVDREDYLVGVDTALATYLEIDPGRLGVSGGSYGGFMTNWLTATTDRFHAAVTSRSIANWESWWGTSDAQGLTEYEFYGPPWVQRDLYRRLSPISYVENVVAPTLIIHSENDYRTPIGDGEQWFMSLRKLGVPVELVRYPRSSHGLSRTGEPWLLVDRLERLRSWFEHFLIQNPPGTRVGAGSGRWQPGGFCRAAW